MFQYFVQYPIFLKYSAMAIAMFDRRNDRSLKKCILFYICTNYKILVSTMAEGSSNGTLSNGQNSRETEREVELNALRQSNKQFKSENEELRRRLTTLERLSEENSRLRRVKEESESLRSRLSAAQEDISGLLKEKRVLQETVTDLRDQVTRVSDPGNSNRASWSIKR